MPAIHTESEACAWALLECSEVRIRAMQMQMLALRIATPAVGETVHDDHGHRRPSVGLGSQEIGVVPPLQTVQLQAIILIALTS